MFSNIEVGIHNSLVSYIFGEVVQLADYPKLFKDEKKLREKIKEKFPDWKRAYCVVGGSTSFENEKDTIDEVVSRIYGDGKYVSFVPKPT